MFSPVLQILSQDTGTHTRLNQLTASLHYTTFVMSSFMYVCLDLNVDIFICWYIVLRVYKIIVTLSESNRSCYWALVSRYCID